MRLSRSIAAALILAACLALSTRAADDKKDPAAPAADAAKEKPKTVRLFKPWSDMTSLSDEQRDKIREIHTKALEDIKAIQMKQHDDIVALLTDDQKKELQKLESAAKSGRAKPADATSEKKE